MSLAPLVILAAGKSSRMDQPKGLLELNGEFWLKRQIRMFAKAGGTEVTVVLGFDHELYFQKIPALKKAEADEASIEGITVKAVINRQPDRGQLSSIQCGLELSEQDAFLLPIDVPAPAYFVWNDLTEAKAKDVDVVIPIYNNQGGHPILLDYDFQEKILDENPESTRMDQILHEVDAERVRRVTVNDASILLNLNTPDEWQRLKS